MLYFAGCGCGCVWFIKCLSLRVSFTRCYYAFDRCFLARTRNKPIFSPFNLLLAVVVPIKLSICVFFSPFHKFTHSYTLKKWKNEEEIVVVAVDPIVVITVSCVCIRPCLSSVILHTFVEYHHHFIIDDHHLSCMTHKMTIELFVALLFLTHTPNMFLAFLGMSPPH